ncbi:unknown [Neodiprion lecontei nucleopolyhedrovirus]|uniref:Uncharacterized protein n=1 Tax=Neodiprion lecontei nucleopolyhedrovirus (strain Canada) TaxID=654906 RepID=Q6JPG1_NPVNC|nr:unknown [Neodiprion lecontei nucleopolyhedrovirus]AAQ99054.1 unknown [Neodiprion lecontei nucleopolyhedrovirus]
MEQVVKYIEHSTHDTMCPHGKKTIASSFFQHILQMLPSRSLQCILLSSDVKSAF